MCNTRRAFVLVDRGKAEVLEHAEGVIRSAMHAFPKPSVIRLIYMIKRPRPQMRLTRREVFVRDRFTCQYCGKQGRDLTIDHVLPRHRGGRHSWENLVASCRHCNHKKAGRTPNEARMDLLTQPRRPPASSYYVFYHYLEAQSDWRKFIPGWEQYEDAAG
ncbi:MAG TPA: HNH endonuclease [Dehalococcoidia bacterium]|nr:HNH endonuclease [Dehalococcoidia bacterium]